MSLRLLMKDLRGATIMITRRATETEFKRLTTAEYLQGGYGLE